MLRRGIACSLLLGVVLLGVGCQFGRRSAPPPRQETTEWRQQLRVILDEYVRNAAVATEAAILPIVDRSADETLIATARRWRQRVVDQVTELAANPDPGVALLDVWAFVSQGREALEDGSDDERFGEYAGPLHDAMAVLETQIESIAAQSLDREKFAQIDASVNQFADREALDSIVTAERIKPFSADTESQNFFQSLGEIVWSPFKLAGDAGRNIDPVERLRISAERLPNDFRTVLSEYTSELLAREQVRASLESWNSVAQTLERAVALAESLPEEISTQLETVFARLDEQQPQLQKTLTQTSEVVAQSDQVVAQVDGALARSKDVLASVEQVSASLRETVGATEQLIRTAGDTIERVRGDADQSNGPATASASAEPAPPFDINDYRALADSATLTAAELRELLGDVDHFLESEALVAVEARVDGILADVDGRGRAMTDHIALRLAQLAGLVFVLAVLYRVFERRVIPRRDQSA